MKLKEAARRVRDTSQASIRRLLLHRELMSLDRNLVRGQLPSERAMERLVRAWDNQAWSTGVPLLAAIFEWLPKTTGSIVECGSGLSTLMLASAAHASARNVFSFEHEPSWGARVFEHLPPHLRSYVEVAITPLQNFGEFDWYSEGQHSIPTSIGFVLCDGPPGATRGGRYGLAPRLRDRLAPGCIVLLDDTQRSEEQAIVRRWCSELPATIVKQAPTYTVLSVTK